MIYRRPIRDVVEERHGRMFGVHVFMVYALALAAVLGMSSACLAATRTGYFNYVKEITVLPEIPDGANIQITYGWRLMCSTVKSSFIAETWYGCFGLDEKEYIPSHPGIIWAVGSSMTADTGLAIALGHAVAAAIALTHGLFFVLLLLNIEPIPVRGYQYMRGLGLMSALTSFYLIFTCVVSFFFGVKDSLESSELDSSGLRPSWAYFITMVDVALMMLLAIRACHDDEIDTAIATPQYTSSSRNEDTVKRASGQLLHLRSRSSDMILEGCVTNFPTSAPKATVAGPGNGDGLSLGLGLGLGRSQPPVPSVSLFRGQMIAGSTAMAAAEAAGAADASSPVPSISFRSSWTGQVSGFSPLPRRRGGTGFDGDELVDDVEKGERRVGGAQGQSEEEERDDIDGGARLFVMNNQGNEGDGVEATGTIVASAGDDSVVAGACEIPRQHDQGALAWSNRCSERGLVDIQCGGASVGVGAADREEGRSGGSPEAPGGEVATLPRGTTDMAAPFEGTLAEFSTARTDVSVDSGQP